MGDDDVGIEALARETVRSAERAVLATTHRAAGAAWPFASLVLTACDHDGSPIMLLSTLAEHTRNFTDDPRVSLLFDGTAGLDNPLTGPRLTLLGEVAPTAEPRHRARFLARHPDAAMYAGFGDFGFYRVDIARAHFVAGFGRIRWLERAAMVADTSQAITLVEGEADIVGHMNDDHADAVALYARVLLGLPGTGWRMTGVDPLGFDLRRDGRVGRVSFAKAVHTPEAARGELVRLVHEARAKDPRQ